MYVLQYSYGTLRKTYHEDLKMVYFSVAMAVYFWMAIYSQTESRLARAKNQRNLVPTS